LPLNEFLTEAKAQNAADHIAPKPSKTSTAKSTINNKSYYAYVSILDSKQSECKTPIHDQHNEPVQLAEISSKTNPLKKINKFKTHLGKQGKNSDRSIDDSNSTHFT
jgi:hypothetical protein